MSGELQTDEAFRAALAERQECDGDRVLTRYIVIAEYAGTDGDTHFHWSYSEALMPWVMIGMLAWCQHRVTSVVDEIYREDDEGSSDG